MADQRPLAGPRDQQQQRGGPQNGSSQRPGTVSDARDAEMRARLEGFESQVMSPRVLGQIKSSLPITMQSDAQAVTLAQEAFNAVRMNPKLMDYPIATFFRTLTMIASAGLSIAAGEAYIVPYKGVLQHQWGYKGLLKLVRRSELVGRVNAQVIRQNDRYRIELGSDERVLHEPTYTGDPGPMIGAYAYAYLRGDAAPIIEWMRASQIEEIRKRAPSADSPAWRDFPEEMWRKIVLKRLTKKLPTADPFTMKVMKDLEDTIEGESQAVAGEGLSALAYHPEVPFEAPPVDNREPVEHGQDERGWQDEQRREAEPDQDRGRREEPPRQDAPAARQQQAKGGGTKKQQPEWPE